MTSADTALLHENIRSIADDWKAQRAERLMRRRLDHVDFDALRDVGFLRAVVPEEMGGLWHDTATSARVVCEVLRVLGSADPAVALVAAMHPSVIAFWLLNPDSSQPEWELQRRAVFSSAMAGEQWGTITSEPGSGGDIARTRATAVPVDDPAFMPGRSYLVSGDKHFGSGSGVADRMMTTALPEGEDTPTIFVLDTVDRRWDGSAGFTLLAEWDGVGMAATQSHAMRLDRAQGVRLARDGPLSDVTGPAGAFVASTFIAVIIGVLDEALSLAKQQLLPKMHDLRAYEQVEWTRAVTDHWLAVQAYEGALRAIEADDPEASFSVLCAKESVAELAEATLGRLARVIGGGTFSRRNPFAHWNEDVRALGFLRPPWGLAYDNLFALSFA
jgi:alkylation response protein AidB-like acyl-CoA dehydrogenase